MNSVPESEWEVLEPHALAEVEHDGLEDEDGPGRAEDGERLPGEEAVGDAHDQARYEGLDGGDPGNYGNWSYWTTRIRSQKVTDQIKNLFSVASPRRPPKVMMGVRHAK